MEKKKQNLDEFLQSLENGQLFENQDSLILPNPNEDDNITGGANGNCTNRRDCSNTDNRGTCDNRKICNTIEELKQL